jgi:hypothetical protein
MRLGVVFVDIGEVEQPPVASVECGANLAPEQEQS